MANIFLSSDGARLVSPTVAVGVRRTWVPCVALLLYAAAILVIGARHEAWFDEAQAWLIARDATPLEIARDYGRYEGTPPLWHLLLWAPAHLGFPYRYLWLISGGLGLVGSGLVLFRAPFPMAMRCGIVASYFFAYQFSIVARSYALDLAILPLLAMLFGARLDRPLAYCGALALLANANAHSFLISGVLGLEYTVAAVRAGQFKVPRVLFGAALYGAAVVAAVAMAWPPRDVSFQTNGASPLNALRALEMMAEPFVERTDFWILSEPSALSRLLGVATTIIVLVPSLRLFRAARTQLVFAGAFAVFFAFTATKYGQIWHTGILFTVWVFALWTSWPALPKLAPRQRTALFVSLFAVLGIQVWYTAAAWARDINEVYSPGENVAVAVADYRRSHPRAAVKAFGFKTFAVQPWVRSNLFADFNDGAATPAFYDWRLRQSFKPYPTLPTWTKATQETRGDILLLSNFEHVSSKEREEYYALAAKAGLCGRVFNGQMNWKGYERENNDIVMFTRCGV